MKGILYGFLIVTIVCVSVCWADHSHRCASCGTIWSHGDNDPNASHNCPRCGQVQTTQYSGGGGYAGAQAGARPVRGFFRWALGPRRPRIQNNISNVQANYYGVPPATYRAPPVIQGVPSVGCAGSVPAQGWYQYGQPPAVMRGCY